MRTVEVDPASAQRPEAGPSGTGTPRDSTVSTRAHLPFRLAPGRRIVHHAEYLTTPTRAADIQVGDLIVHPRPSEHGALHKVTKVTHGPDHVVIHSRHTQTGALRRYRAQRHHIIQKVLAGVLSLLTAVGIFATAARSQIFEPPPRAPTAVTQVVDPPVTRVPAPRTAAGYQRLFSNLDPTEWGAGDGALTVPLPDGRTVWLFGDTMSARENGFVHSTAIVQSGGALHVSHRGAQLLPDDDAMHIYWIQTAKAAGDTNLEITARSIILTGTGLWDFEDAGCSRTAACSVSPTGDVTFHGWTTGKVICPPSDPGPMYNFGDANPNHFGYLRFTHPELKLAGGKVLVSTSQNWTDTWDRHCNPDGSFRWTDYQPVFTEASPPQ